VKVVHIGDSEFGGGAAHAMSRLHGALRRLGVDSNVLVRNGSAPGAHAEALATRGAGDEYFPAVRDAVVRQYVELNRTAISNTHFSLHIDGTDLSGLPLVASSDIVHLHWTASFQTPADVRALFVAKPVVWTLHDLEPLTGGCHFPAGCAGYVDDCAGCPQLVRDPFHVTATTLHAKQTLWEGCRPTFVAPSRYVAECARSSAVARHAGASIVHIPGGIDIEMFRPRSKADARRALGIPEDGTYVLCGSNYNAEKRKGLDALGRMVAAAKARSRIDSSTLRILTVGEPKLDPQDFDGTEVIQLGRASATVMPVVYAAADLFLHPAVEDNFPCMILESLSCGTPALAFDIGGVADLVRDEECGRLVAAGDELAMAAALSSLLDDRDRLVRMGAHARARVEAHFSDVSIARRHAELYADVLEERAASPSISALAQQSGIEKIFPRWSNACLVDELAFARERAALLVEGARSRSQRIAALERETAALAGSLAEQSPQMAEKEAELTAVHQVAEDRRALTEQLHAALAGMEAMATNLRATIGEQHVEIEMVHRVADERRMLLEDLHRAAALTSAEQSRQIHEKEAELLAIRVVAEQRKALAERLHASAARMEAAAANLQREVGVRDELLARLKATIAEQRAEIELVHAVAAERRALIEELHRAVEERKLSADTLHALAAMSV
jgi:glycosyltransferase involved in cell wall biosynthesis